MVNLIMANLKERITQSIGGGGGLVNPVNICTINDQLILLCTVYYVNQSVSSKRPIQINKFQNSKVANLTKSLNHGFGRVDFQG